MSLPQTKHNLKTERGTHYKQKSLSILNSHPSLAVLKTLIDPWVRKDMNHVKIDV